MAAAALLSLQAIDLPPIDRRQRAVKRGTSLLDRLDEVRLGLLDGAVRLSVLQGLQAELRRGAGVDDDARLHGLLQAIDLRCAVELAKLEAAGASD